MILQRLLIAAAVVAGFSYMAGWSLDLPEALSTIWKGSGVALLALAVAVSARDADHWLLVVLLALGAAGDVLLETHGLTTGAVAFLIGHLAAIALYLRHRRAHGRADAALAAAIAGIIGGTAFAITADRAMAPGVALYATGLGVMTASAFLSRFPRGLTALGAAMFAVSDLLIFLRTGRPALATTAMGIAVWSLYFAGQTLVCLGGLSGLRRQQG